MSYTSVSRVKLQKAFAVAHRASEDAWFSTEARTKFREIAKLLWEAHGEEGKPPANAGAELLSKIEASEAR